MWNITSLLYYNLCKLYKLKVDIPSKRLWQLYNNIIYIEFVYSSNSYFINKSAYFIDFTPGETQEYIFVDDGDRELERSFSTTEDFVVENIEIFEVVLTVNDSRVRIRENASTQFVRIRDDDGKFVFLFVIFINKTKLSVLPMILL